MRKMQFALSGLCAWGVLITGCSRDITTKDMLSVTPPPPPPPLPRSQALGMRADTDALRTPPEQMWSFYNSIRAAAGRPQVAAETTEDDVRGSRPGESRSPRTWATPQSDAANRLLRCNLVQDLADAVWTRETTGERIQRNISAADCRQFIDVLTADGESLLGKLSEPVGARTQGAGVSFDRVFRAYLRAYAGGDFVARDGTNISKPALSGGISDEDVQGLTLVFFEAVYDCLYDMPVLYSVHQSLETKYDPARITGPAERDTLTLGPVDGRVDSYFQWNNRPLFFGSGDAQPTAYSSELARRERVRSKEDGQTRVTEAEARAIQRISSLAGKQSKALVGTVFGFLSNVNVSVVIGADFAIGDNETLLHAVETIAEVTARRSSEYVSYRAAREFSADASRGESGALRATPEDTSELESRIENALLSAPH